MSGREYPDIEFVSTETEPLINTMILMYEKMTGRTLYPADPARQFILWTASVLMQMHMLINEAAKQNVPRYAKGEYLDSLAEIFYDIQRLSAQAAQTTLRFTRSETSDSGMLIPEGTRVATVDSGIIFATVEPGYIEAGELWAEVSAKCQSTGAQGNGFVAGQISRIVDRLPSCETVENTTTSANGSESESDAAFYARMRESLAGISTAGPAGAYTFLAKSASPLISDVTVSSPEPGKVSVKLLLEGGRQPDEEMLAMVQEYLSARDRRPLTDYVTVSAPDTYDFQVDFAYWIAEENAASASIIEEDVAAAVKEYLRWQTAKMGRDINPSYLISLVMAAGVKRVEVAQPVYAEIAVDTVPVLQGEAFVRNGGIEPE